jgi:septum formation topological specificity factor MinE
MHLRVVVASLRTHKHIISILCNLQLKENIKSTLDIVNAAGNTRRAITQHASDCRLQWYQCIAPGWIGCLSDTHLAEGYTTLPSSVWDNVFADNSATDDPAEFNMSALEASTSVPSMNGTSNNSDTVAMLQSPGTVSQNGTQSDPRTQPFPLPSPQSTVTPQQFHSTRPVPVIQRVKNAPCVKNAPSMCHDPCPVQCPPKISLLFPDPTLESATMVTDNDAQRYVSSIMGIYQRFLERTKCSKQTIKEKPHLLLAGCRAAATELDITKLRSTCNDVIALMKRKGKKATEIDVPSVELALWKVVDFARQVLTLRLLFFCQNNGSYMNFLSFLAVESAVSHSLKELHFHSYCIIFLFVLQSSSLSSK